MDDGVLRRSLRRINPFKNKLFRLPATPRLARSKKVNGDDVVTEWNFERASTRSRGYGQTPSTSTTTATTPTSPDTLSLPVIKQGPPEPREAELSIHEHMRQLLPAAVNRLPNTRYTHDGHVRHAVWPKEFEEVNSNTSTLSLLSTTKHARSVQPGTPIFSRNGSLRTSYPLNGIARPPSTEPRKPMAAMPSSGLQPLFTLNDTASPTQLEDAFIGREWVFREVYQSSIVDKISLTVIEGERGSGKTTIFNQLVLNSPFFVHHTSDTIDSGCVLEAPLPSRNYEWLRAVAGRVVAYHCCCIQNAATCSLPELVCNLGAMLASSSVLKSYAVILAKKPELRQLLRLDECLKRDTMDVFQKAIVEPLSQIKCTDQGSLVILIDGVDEAEFHRSEDGRSVIEFCCHMANLLPSWIRLIVTADASGVAALGHAAPNIVRIDDGTVDDRVVRDNRMFVEYRVSVLKELEDTVFAMRRLSLLDPLSQLSQRLVAASCGNVLYLRLLLQLVETGKLHVSQIVNQALPQDLHTLYTLYMDLTFTSESCFERVSPILDVLLASLRPLRKSILQEIFNSGGPSTAMTYQDLDEALTILAPLLSISVDDNISLHHPAFREWLLSNSVTDRYRADARKGHLLIALWLAEQAPLQPSQLMEMGHHLLKAHPYKYMQGQYVPELTSTKDGQILWIQKSSADMTAALDENRNMHYPNAKVTRLLLVAGADPSYVPPETTSNPFPLSVSQKAVAAGHWSLVSLLLHYGAGLHPDTGPCLLAMAARHGHEEIVRHLLPLDSGRGIREALIEAAAHAQSGIIPIILSANWTSEDYRLSVIEDALCSAAAHGHTPICQALTDAHSETDISRAMRVACEKGRAATVQFFLSRGASLSSLAWPDEKPALHCAVESGSWDLVVAVLGLPETELDQKDSLGRTPLMSAAKCGHVGLVDMLINKGASVDHTDRVGWTALAHAVHEGHLSCVQLLVDREADLNITDVNGNTLAHIACSDGSRSMIDRLIEGGMLFEEKDRNGDRPIEIAIRSRNRPALDALLRRGARLRSSTWQAARESDHEALLILLTKLVDDAGILFRKKRLDDAMHRLRYALDKCDLTLADLELTSLYQRVQRLKQQILLAMARIQRREGQLEQAIETCQLAADAAENEDALFEVLLLRAKCRFDCHDVERARADARAASRIRPSCDEARHLLNTLQLPTTSIARL